jgi:hypothetical protein
LEDGVTSSGESVRPLVDEFVRGLLRIDGTEKFELADDSSGGEWADTAVALMKKLNTVPLPSSLCTSISVQ